MRMMALKFWTPDCISTPIPGSSSGRSHSPSKLGHDLTTVRYVNT